MAENESEDTFWSGFCTFIWVRYFNLKDLIKTIYRYWRKPRFALVDFCLLLRYFFKSPYRIAREFDASEPYGETPLSTLDAIVQACPINPTDTVYELGSGRGRACLWLSAFKGYNTIGLENNPIFVERAQKIAQLFKVDNVQFLLEDIFTADFSKANWIYLFGTAFSDEEIKKLIKRFERLQEGTKIITISYSLKDYTKSKKFLLLHALDVEFAWGTTQAFIHEVRGIH